MVRSGGMPPNARSAHARSALMAAGKSQEGALTAQQRASTSYERI